MTLRVAADAHLRAQEARNLAKGTRAHSRSLLDGLIVFAESQGVTDIDAIDRALPRRWGEARDWKPNTHRQRLKVLKRLLAHAERKGWVEDSPAVGLVARKSDSAPTLALEMAEMVALLEISAAKPREWALLLVMRYSGLAIGVAVALEQTVVQAASELILRRTKAGTLVTVPLPSYAVDALDRIEEPSRR